jgi:hypothetical protein
MSAGLQAAIAHYDNTGNAAAAVGAGEDRFGIWVNGVLLDHVTDEQIQLMRLSPLSGDWRRVRGNLELVAALSVNTAGFPIAHVRDASTYALVASGGTWIPQEDEPQDTPEAGEDERKARAEKLEKIKQNDRASRLARLTS